MWHSDFFIFPLILTIDFGPISWPFSSLTEKIRQKLISRYLKDIKKEHFLKTIAISIKGTQKRLSIEREIKQVLRLLYYSANDFSKFFIQPNLNQVVLVNEVLFT